MNNWRFLLLFVLLLFAKSDGIGNSQTPKELLEYGENVLYYKTPLFDLKNTNVTFGATRRSGGTDKVTAESLALTVASVCQANLINQKAYPIQIDGIMNLVFQDFTDPRTIGQQATVRIFENSLYFTKNNSKLNTEMDIELTGFFSAFDFETDRTNSYVGNGYVIPYVAAGDLARANPNDKIYGGFFAQSINFAQILDTQNYNSFNAVLDILKFFNWTIVADLYQSSAYGYSRQQSVFDYSAKNTLPVFACGSIFGTIDQDLKADRELVLTQFCDCVAEKDTIQVIVLWMSTTYAAPVISNLRKVCGSLTDKWTYIVTEDYQSPINYSNDAETFKNTLLLRLNGPWSVPDFVNDCRENAGSEELLTEIDKLVNYFYTETYNCELSDTSVQVETEGLKECEGEFIYTKNQSERCLCKILDADGDPYASRIFYIADLINVYAAAISILQNNCTLLNDAAGETRRGPFIKKDYCALKKFDPSDLSYALRFVNITGYTGPIAFDFDSMIRLQKSYYLYSTNSTTINAQLVGIVNSTYVNINSSAIYFIDNKIPTSSNYKCLLVEADDLTTLFILGAVPQNPDLSYAVVDVFFGISILQVIVSFIVLVLFIYYRDHVKIRKSAPLTSITMLCSLLIISAGEVIQCFGRYDTFCIINIYTFWIGLLALLSCLFLKNYRVYIIFSNKKATAVNISEKKLLVIVTGLLFLYACFLTVVVVVLDYSAVLLQSSSNPFYLYYRCAIPNTTWFKIYEIFMQITMIIMVLASILVSWLTRKAYSEYSETKVLVAFSLLVLACIIVLVPLNYALGSDTDSELFRFLIVAEFITIVVIAALVLLFLPKLYDIFRAQKKDQNRRKSITTSRLSEASALNR